jgi:homoserine O-acetyltransferase/O-succinyltransferase
MLDNDYYSQENQGPYSFFEIDNFLLDSSAVIKNLHIAYSTHGTLNAAKDNVILFPHMFSGTSKSLEAYVGEGRALDPSKYFIIFPNQIGNGVSTSPHNTDDSSITMSSFPTISISDDVRAQHMLLSELFGVKEIQLVLGWSMGAQQTYEWAVRYPDIVKRAAPIGGTARTSPHNAVMVEGLMGALQTAEHFNGGSYTSCDQLRMGLNHLAVMFASIGVSREFYTLEHWRDAGFDSLESFLTDFWMAWFKPMDANALLIMLDKWRRSDVSKQTNGDLAAALGRIKAIVHNMPFVMDMMFTEPECRADSELIPNCTHKPIPSTWGHFTMFGVFPNDFDFIDNQLKELLNTPI